MADNAKILPLEPAPAAEFELDSGRRLRMRSEGDEDQLQIVEPGGTVSLTVRLTDAGPVIVAEGASLQLRATESIEIQARRVSLEAEEQIDVRTDGTLSLKSKEELRIHSDDDVRATAKIIHLN